MSWVSPYFQVELEECTGNGWRNMSARKWADFTLPKPAITDRVLLTVLSVYRTRNNGFIEVELTAKPGMCHSMTSTKTSQAVTGI